MESYETIEQYGIDGGLRAIAEAGFDGADISFYCNAEHTLLGADYREKALEIKAALARYGLSCRQAHAPFPFLSRF